MPAGRRVSATALCAISLLGFRAVNGLGEAFKAGGKVVKNVTGFDIPKLVCGAFGTLCVLTEVTLARLSEAIALADVGYQGRCAGRRFCVAAQGVGEPLEATGLAYADGSALFRLEGEEAPLRKKIGMLKILCGGRDIRAGEETVFRGVGKWRHIPPIRCVRLAHRGPAVALTSRG